MIRNDAITQKYKKIKGKTENDDIEEFLVLMSDDGFFELPVVRRFM